MAATFIKFGGDSLNYIFLKHAKQLMLVHFLILFYSLLVLIFVGDNFLYLLAGIKASIVFLAIIFYLDFYKEKFDERFMGWLLLLYCLNALINFGAGTFPEYFAWAEVFRSPVISNSLGINPYRNNFISGSGYFSIGTAYGLFFLFFIFSKKKFEIGMFSSVCLMITILAGVLGARTSIFAIFAGLVYLLAKSQLKQIISLVVIFTLFFYFAFDDDGILGPYQEWLLSFFSGKEDASADSLLNEMFYWPGEKIFLMGSGFVNNGRFEYTDSGFMQDILFGGILYMILKFLFPIYFVVKFFKVEPIFVLLFLGVAIAYQLKGAFFVNNAQGMVIFYIMYFYFCEKYAHSLKKL